MAGNDSQTVSTAEGLSVAWIVAILFMIITVLLSTVLTFLLVRQCGGCCSARGRARGRFNRNTEYYDMVPEAVRRSRSREPVWPRDGRYDQGSGMERGRVAYYNDRY